MYVCRWKIYENISQKDEKSISDAICTRLKKEKYNVDIALDGEEVLYDVLLNIYVNGKLINE